MHDETKSKPVKFNRLKRIAIGALIFCWAQTAFPQLLDSNSGVNGPRVYQKKESSEILSCIVDVSIDLGKVDRRIFGTNLEWFNNAGGFVGQNQGAITRLVELTAQQGITNYRFPGGILADYYHWVDGTGPRNSRPTRKHPSDSGQSSNDFGSPEFFQLIKRTGGEGMITVNAGTGSAAEAAAWVAYTNAPVNSKRASDGFREPVGIKLWEVGNELYLPGNPHEQKISVTPEIYAQRYIQFADAMRAVDPSISVIAIGVAKSHIGPDTEFPDWTEKLLQRAADKIDMIAIHNAYFPMLYKVRQPKIEEVYPPLWASPEAVDRSLDDLEKLIKRYESNREIGIAITEWGSLFSLPRADPYWVDHVKTLGSAVYVGRLMQVFMSHPRVKVANYFKLSDRSFMGWINYEGKPKVPYWAFQLYAKHSGDHRVSSTLNNSPTFNTQAIGVMAPQSNVKEVTVVATRSSSEGKLFVNIINRSMATIHKVRLDIRNFTPSAKGEILMLTGEEPTAHNGRDIPPEWPYSKDYEPYTTAPPNSIQIIRKPWMPGDVVAIPPFSIVTVEIRDSKPSR
jgi:alpha-N-arabinofuranosidase